MVRVARRGGRRYLAGVRPALPLAPLLPLALLWAACRAAPPAPPPILGALPAFELTDEASRVFGAAELRGRPYVADFVYTGCTGGCPLLTARMASLQEKLAETSVRLVTVTVDPARDTPARLAEYGRRAGADFSRWSFLTGSPEAVRDLVVHGFKVTMGKAEADDPGEILHDGHLVLVDGAGRIRGYYAADPDGERRLVRDARSLASAHPAPVAAR